MRLMNLIVSERTRRSLFAAAALALVCWPAPLAHAGIDKEPTCKDFFWDTTPGDPGISGTTVSATNVFAMAIVGNDLYVGGQFTGAGGNPMTNIARWNGAEWISVGDANGIVRAMAQYEGELYAAGEFTTIGGISANRIARFDGTDWHALPSGPTAQGNRTIRALAVHDGELFIGGSFSGFIGVSNSMRIVRWNGTSFSNVGGYTITGQINALASYDGDLYMAGALTNIRPPATTMNIPIGNIARWDGAAWNQLGSPPGTNGAVYALMAFGDTLYVGGTFTSAGGAPAARIAAWDGAWSAPGAIASGNVHAMVAHDDGKTINLFVGGSFNSVSGVSAQNIAQFDGANWTALLGGVGINTSTVYALASHSECVLRGAFQPSLYAGGNFLIADAGPTAERVARWVACEDDGGTDPNDPCDEGWDIASGNPGPDDVVWTLKSFGFTDGCTGEHYLYAGGEFDGLDDPIDLLRGASVDSPGLLRWDGEVWSDVDGGVYRRTGPNEYLDGVVYALHEFNANDGGGNQLYVGGILSTLGTFLPEPPDTEASLIGNNLLRTDGFTWTDIGGVGLGTNQHTTGVIRALASDDGPRLNDEPTLYVGGGFDAAGVPGGVPHQLGPVEANNVAQWDAANGWDALGGGVNGIVYAMIFTNIGEGDSLYVGGEFDEAYNEIVFADGTRGFETVVVDHIARWDGEMWHAVGAGFDDAVIALTVFDDGDGAKLYAGGQFAEAGDAGVRGIDNLFGGVARWDGQEWERVGDFLYNDSLDPPFAVYNLTVYDDGHGERLFAGGAFLFTGVPPVFNVVGNLAVLNTNINQWEASEHGAVFGASLNGAVLAMEPFFDGKGGNTDPLYVGGLFDVVSVDPTDVFLSQPEGATDFQLTRNVAAIRTCGARPCDPLVDGEYANPGADDAVFAVWPFSTFEVEPLPNFIDTSFTLIGGSFESVEGNDRIGSALRTLTGTWFRAVDLYQSTPNGDRSQSPGDAYAITESPTDKEFVKFGYIGGAFGEVQYVDQDGTQSVFTDNIVGVVLSEVIFPFELGHGVSDDVYALEAASDAAFGGGDRGQLPDVYPLLDAVVFAGGAFTNAYNPNGDDVRGGEPIDVNYVARWDSDTNLWSPLGDGFNDNVLTLLLDESGSDPLLYAGGLFTGSGGPADSDEAGVVLNHVAVFDFDTEQWNDIGGGLNDTVSGLELFQDEGEPTYLFAIGDFTAGDAVDTLDGFAYFDGVDWLPASRPDDFESGRATALHAYDDGQGPALFLAYGVADPEARGDNFSRIARYRNGEWTYITDPILGVVLSMRGYLNEIDTYHYLVVGGVFDEINNVGVQNVTRIRLCPAEAIEPEAACATPRIVELLGTTGEIAYGSPTVMAVAATGLNLNYQWSRNGEPLVDDDRISGATTSMLTISGALGGPEGDTGVYTVAAFNQCGAVGSTGLQLMVMCYGDTDLDGVVSFSDMATVLGQYGQQGAGIEGDLNHDGVVDFTDLSLVLSNYGRDCTSIPGAP